MFNADVIFGCKWKGVKLNFLSNFFLFAFVYFFFMQVTACSTIPESRKDLAFPVEIPFMRMEPSECYYLDDFLPTPDSLVTGKNAGMYLRYYTFNSAIYKFWREEKVMLAFYSRDQRCWSLFEEYATSGFGL